MGLKREGQFSNQLLSTWHIKRLPSNVKNDSNIVIFSKSSNKLLFKLPTYVWFLSRCSTQLFNPFQPSFAFHIETSHLVCTTNQVTGFYMKCNTGLQWVNVSVRDMLAKGDFMKMLLQKRVKAQLFFPRNDNGLVEDMYFITDLNFHLPGFVS